MTILDAALAYHRAGLAVWPAIPEEKRPAGVWGGGRNPRPLDEKALKAWGRIMRGLCILCGNVSGGVECIDFDDKGSVYDTWREAVTAAHPGLPERLVMERSPSGGVHVVYRCPEADRPRTRQLAFAPDDGRLLVETRGDGAVFLCDPTPGYQLFQGSHTAIPTITLAERDALIALAAAQGVPKTAPAAPRSPVVYVPVPAGEMHPYIAKALADEAAEVAACPEGGRNHRLNKAAFKLGHYVGGGVLSEDMVRSELTRAALAAGLGAHETALSITSGLAAGIRDPKGVPEASPDDGGVNMDGLAAQARRVAQGPRIEVVSAADDEEDGDIPEDDFTQITRLEPLPHELLGAPGFLNDAVDWGMNAAFYPNRPMIFASALATLATLTARKIMADPQTRPNIYTLAIATSGVGKDTGNDIAANILREAGMGNAVQYRFSSAEGIEDAFWDTSPAILWLCDEIDGWLRSAKVDGGHAGNAQGKIDTMLSYFTASHKTLQRRQKARPLGAKRRESTAEPEIICQPHLSVYGTCTPRGFFSAFNERVAGGGFLGRLLIFDADRRGLAREPTADITVPPPALLDAARFWAEHPCGGGNLSELNPTPRAVEFTPEAKELNLHNTHWVDGESYTKHEKVGDEIGCSIWARTGQYAKKLALLYAASANPTHPIIDTAAIRWGWEIARRQSERMIVLVGRHSADNPFQELCLKILNRLRAERGGPVSREELLRLTRAKKADFDTAMETLAERREIAMATMNSTRRPKVGYRLRVRRHTRA